MPYLYINLTQAIALLADRLYDLNPNSQFWSDGEKTVYIQQAMRTFGSLTNYWRAEFLLETSANKTWYDITNTAVAPNTLRPLTVTDQSLVNLIQYHLLEPISPAYPLTWTGSNQFSISDILGAIQRRRDEILSETSCTITQSSVIATTGRTFLPDTTIDIRRIAWLPVPGFGYTNTPLLPDDEWGLQYFENGYTVNPPSVPSSYRQSTQPPLAFDVDSPLIVPGVYDILTVNAGSALSTTQSSLLSIPDDFTWTIVFGALSELFNRDSNARDSLRAQYCEMRYKQGLALLKVSSATLYARISNIPLDVDSAQNQDNFNQSWQAQTPQQPQTLLTAGLNIVGCSPTPDTGYSITLGVVQNTPIPVNGTDNLQVGRDELDAILDYAQHLASLKMGGLEFLSTMPLLGRFHKMAASYNSKLNELGEFKKPMYELSQLQAQTVPVFEESENDS
jgi:hypothetical protein